MQRMRSSAEAGAGCPLRRAPHGSNGDEVPPLRAQRRARRAVEPREGERKRGEEEVVVDVQVAVAGIVVLLRGALSGIGVSVPGWVGVSRVGVGRVWVGGWVGWAGARLVHPDLEGADVVFGPRSENQAVCAKGWG